jgi:hypothetical protein
MQICIKRILNIKKFSLRCELCLPGSLVEFVQTASLRVYPSFRESMKRPILSSEDAIFSLLVCKYPIFASKTLQAQKSLM